jgi:hypothetical protein
MRDTSPSSVSGLNIPDLVKKGVGVSYGSTNTSGVDQVLSFDTFLLSS